MKHKSEEYELCDKIMNVTNNQAYFKYEVIIGIRAYTNAPMDTT